jgi:hypothetical protein
MVSGRRIVAIRFAKYAFFALVTVCVLLTLSALADSLLQAGWGLGWQFFFVGFIASAWGIVAYQLCGSLFGWSKKHR